MMLARDGNVDGSRWCAGCHDPVPLFSGAFDRADFDTDNDPDVAGRPHLHGLPRHRAGQQHPRQRRLHDRASRATTRSPSRTSPALREVSKQLIKAKPAFHKTTFLKPVHRTAEFCSTCHKVHIPGALNDYKEFLRGQNHYDSFILSGVSGRGARSFYYPPKAEARCAGCHMPLRHLARLRRAGASTTAARCRSTITASSAANTGVAHLRGDAETVQGAPGVPRQGRDARPLRPARGRHGVGPPDRPARRRRARRCSPASATWSRSSCARARSATTSRRAPPTPTRSGWR